MFLYYGPVFNIVFMSFHFIAEQARSARHITYIKQKMLRFLVLLSSFGIRSSFHKEVLKNPQVILSLVQVNSGLSMERPIEPEGCKKKGKKGKREGKRKSYFYISLKSY